MKFRKQFILSNDKVDIWKEWNTTSVEDMFLYTHPELEVSISSNEKSLLVLIGDAFDYRNPTYTNQNIVDLSNVSALSVPELLVKFSQYSGTFAVFYFHFATKRIIAFNDTTAQREIYYFKESSSTVLASQPKLIDVFFDPKIDLRKSAKAFYNSTTFKNKRSYVGNLTEYENIFHLKPNHYLDVVEWKTRRFFPFEKLSGGDLNEVAHAAADIIKGSLEAAAYRYKLILPVSAGWDSRILLAASKDIRDQVHFYILKFEDYDDQHQDIKIPRKLLAHLGLELHVIDNGPAITEEQKKVIDECLSFPNYENFKYILGYWGTLPGKCLSLIGNTSEVTRMEWDDIKNVNAEKIAFLQKYPNLEYALEYYGRWLEESGDCFTKNNYAILDMLYWEENCGNWLAKANTESKFGIEYFLPFSSRELMSLMLTVDKKYRSKQNSQLHKKIIEILWKDCLVEPINPSFKKQVIKLFQKLGLYSWYRNKLLAYQMQKLK